MGHEDGEENVCFENVTTIGENDVAAVTTLSNSFALKRNVRTNGVS